MSRELDGVDRGILYMLQLDARNMTSQEIAEKVGVSASTVRNRLERLVDDGIIKGYHPEIDYEAANLPFRVMFVITAPPAERGEAVERLMDIRGITDVREMLTGRSNIHAEVVGQTTADLVQTTDAIHEIDISIEIESSEIIKQRRIQPFNHFYFSEAIDGIDGIDPQHGDRDGARQGADDS